MLAHDGICSDGGSSPATSGVASGPACLIGTDCDDCGVRTFATCLPTLSGACIQLMLGNGVCDEGCNSVHCSHDADDCNSNQ